MCVSDGTSERYVSAERTVVRALSPGIPIVGPAKWLLSELGRLFKQRVLLLEAVPNIFSCNFGSVPDFLGEVSKVGVSRNELLAGAVLPVPGLCHDKDVVSASERVSVVSDRLKDYFALLSDSLVGTTAIVVPIRKVR